MRLGSLFSGIGGLELGLEMSGLGETIWQCEQDEYCRSILAKHWPNAERFTDVKQLSGDWLEPVDLICGGFPCQDISAAGKGAGLSGERSGLWHHFHRVVEELRPEWVVVENVASGSKRWVDQVAGALGSSGYETLPIPIAASDVGAPHLRRRIFLVAHTEREPLRDISERVPWGRSEGVQREGQAQPVHDGAEGHAPGWCPRAPVDGVRRVDDGLPSDLDRARLKALGNAVVPQCAEVVGHIIQELRR